MAIERREILFSLNEIKDALLVIDNGARRIPVTHDMNLIEAIHTRDLSKQFHVVRDRYTNIYKDNLGKDGIMFRARHSGLLGYDRHYEFFVTDSDMLDAILFACHKAGIMAPRPAHKIIVAEDIFIGIKFEVRQTTLMLEEA